MIKHLEVKTYLYRDIRVMVEINYDKREISLVERENSLNAQNGNSNGYKGKQYLFIKRGLEYMQGWKNVYAALAYATDEASKELSDYIEAQTKEKMENVEAILMEATGIVKRKKK